jgi:hypothetical protein
MKKVYAAPTLKRLGLVRVKSGFTTIVKTETERCRSYLIVDTHGAAGTSATAGADPAPAVAAAQGSTLCAYPSPVMHCRPVGAQRVCLPARRAERPTR